MKWSKNSWRSYEAKQLPAYSDEKKLNGVLDNLSSMPPLIFAGETRSLKSQIHQVQKGDAFYLQGGDCAESFSELNPNTIRDTFKLLLQMSVVLTFATNTPVVKLGRIGGQFAKPRSSDFEEKDVHEAIITASNDNGSDEINLTVFINDSDCEFDTAATS